MGKESGLQLVEGRAIGAPAPGPEGAGTQGVMAGSQQLPVLVPGVQGTEGL